MFCHRLVTISLHFEVHRQDSREDCLLSKLPVYVISDIDENDVLCGIGVEEKKLLLQDKFMCYNEGEQIGVISQKTKTRRRTSN